MSPSIDPAIIFDVPRTGVEHERVGCEFDMHTHSDYNLIPREHTP